MSIAAGKLDKRVLLQRPESSRGSLGGIDRKWIDVGWLWANLSYLSGREFLKNGLNAESCNVSVQIRKSKLTAGISPEWRLVYRGKVFNIQAVLPDSVHAEVINLPCIEGMNAG
ncbi:Bacteriophage head-tail adaptor [Snodgrassella alvi SCGC AB-598-J21]|uniref:Bacteriophage head-tail adaptor n=1 Tax=Snodgrassella alvi SCGC AB-598-J21 TaxID=1385367 RepID=A0A074V5H1_9NEIS|nr:Bacteriophage head-tail adaptor [Snodgrassella alvi SCGC AB-598-J21]